MIVQPLSEGEGVTGRCDDEAWGDVKGIGHNARVGPTRLGDRPHAVLVGGDEGSLGRCERDIEQPVGMLSVDADRSANAERDLRRPHEVLDAPRVSSGAKAVSATASRACPVLCASQARRIAGFAPKIWRRPVPMSGSASWPIRMVSVPSSVLAQQYRCLSLSAKISRRLHALPPQSGRSTVAPAASSMISSSMPTLIGYASAGRALIRTRSLVISISRPQWRR